MGDGGGVRVRRRGGGRLRRSFVRERSLLPTRKSSSSPSLMGTGEERERVERERWWSSAICIWVTIFLRGDGTVALSLRSGGSGL